MRSIVILALSFGIAMSAFSSEPQTVNVAVVRDGPSWYADELTAMIDAELQQLIGDSVRLHFIVDERFDAMWKTERVPLALQHALADSGSQIVLVTGPLGTLFAGHGDMQFGKPVMSVLGAESRLLNLPADAYGLSTRANFSFIADRQRIEKDLAGFHQIFPQKNIHVLLDPHVASAVPGLKSMMLDLGKRLGQKITGISAGANADETLAVLIGSRVEAVYATPLFSMPRGDRQKLFASLAARHVPVFSQIGDEEVQIGALAGINRDFRQRLAHFAALNLQQILQGAPPNSLGGNLAASDALIINAQTAHTIGYVPDFDTKIDADFVSANVLEKGEALSLETAMELAGENNADIAVQQAAVEKAREQSAGAHSAFYPQIFGSARFTEIDRDRAAASGQGIAERDTRAGVKASQVIYDEAVTVREKVSHRVTLQNKFEEERSRLDAMNSSGSSYLQLLLSRSLYEIERNNLRLTRQHLNLARNRYQLGAAGQEEVLRFEAEEARQHGNVLTAQANIEKARVALNRSMGADAGQSWNTQPVSLASDAYYFLDDAGAPAMLAGEPHIAQFRDFSVLKALDAAPELKFMDEAITAQRLVIDQKQRGYFVPQVSANAGYERILDRHFAGADFASELAGAGLPVSVTHTDDNEWQATVSASLPIWEGGARKHDIAAEQAQLDQLEQTRVKTAQQIEQRTLNAVFDIEASHPKIEFARIAADRARRGLQIISDKYSRGAAQIIDVLDAQNQSLREEIGAAVALTEYLQDILEYQRSISWFEKFQPPDARTAWVNHFKRFIGQPTGENHVEK